MIGSCRWDEDVPPPATNTGTSHRTSAPPVLLVQVQNSGPSSSMASPPQPRQKQQQPKAAAAAASHSKAPPSPKNFPSFPDFSSLGRATGTWLHQQQTLGRATGLRLHQCFGFSSFSSQERASTGNKHWDESQELRLHQCFLGEANQRHDSGNLLLQQQLRAIPSRIIRLPFPSDSSAAT